MRTTRNLLPLALLLGTLTLLLAACGGSSSSGSNPNGGTGGGGGNLPTVTKDTCANTLSLAQASAIVGTVTSVNAVVSANSVLCSYIATNGGPALLMDIYVTSDPHTLYTTVQAGYQHLMTLSGYGDAATVGYQDSFPVYTMFLVKGHTYVFIQSTDDNLDSSLTKVKAVAQAILPNLV